MFSCHRGLLSNIWKQFGCQSRGKGAVASGGRRRGAAQAAGRPAREGCVSGAGGPGGTRWLSPAGGREEGALFADVLSKITLFEQERGDRVP